MNNTKIPALFYIASNFIISFGRTIHSLKHTHFVALFYSKERKKKNQEARRQLKYNRKSKMMATTKTNHNIRFQNKMMGI